MSEEEVVDISKHYLDNVMWSALSTRQAEFNRGNDTVKQFPFDMDPFIVVEHFNDDEVQQLIDQLEIGVEAMFAVRRRVRLPADRVQVIVEVSLFQMTLDELKPVYLSDEVQAQYSIRPLELSDVPQMVALANETKPGPFRSRTIDFGGFIGAFDKDNNLCAMAGNRLKVPGYSEVSGICTSPQHLGKGLASALTTQVCQKVLQTGCVPFLHVRGGNDRAVKVYEKLGFSVRAETFYYVFKRTA